jgi:very-short-patch-repair endonuclease
MHQVSIKGKNRLWSTRMTPRARELRKNPTDAERALWRHIRYRQLAGCRFRRQAPVGPYILDFVCFEKKLVIEVDGGQHTEQADYDGVRTAWLESQGFRVLRFWNNQVLQEIEAAKEAILLALTTV